LIEIAASAVPVLFMVTGLIVFSFFSAWLTTRITGMDFTTSLCGASPGMMSAMLILANDLGGNISVVAVMHSLKIVAIIVLMPVITGFFQPGEGALKIADSLAVNSLPLHYGKLAFLIAGGFFAVRILRRTPVPSVEFLGGMLVAAVCNPLFLQIKSSPVLWQIFAIWIIGTSVGTQMSRESLASIKKYTRACIVLVASQAAVGLLLGWILYTTTTIDPVTALIGACPTGMDAMVILAAEMHTNVPLVAAMHTARVIIVILLMPLIIRRVTRKHGAGESG
jgi:membrane AbrB-like protein